MKYQDIRQSLSYASYMESLGWKKEKWQIRNYKLQIYIKRLPILGSFIKIQRSPIPIDKSYLKPLAKKYHAFAVEITYSPTKTLRLNLIPSLEKIKSQMKKDCRYEIRKAEQNNLNVLISQYLPAEASAQAGPNILISHFISLWHQNALRRGFWIPFKKEMLALWQAFDKKAYLVSACHLSPVTCHSLLAGALILIHDHIAYYFHAASTPEGRKLSAPIS